MPLANTKCIASRGQTRINHVNTQDMTAVVTVTGIDHVGIVAAIANALAKLNVNIVNISQTLMDIRKRS